MEEEFNNPEREKLEQQNNVNDNQNIQLSFNNQQLNQEPPEMINSEMQQSETPVEYPKPPITPEEHLRLRDVWDQHKIGISVVTIFIFVLFSVVISNLIFGDLPGQGVEAEEVFPDVVEVSDNLASISSLSIFDTSGLKKEEFNEGDEIIIKLTLNDLGYEEVEDLYKYNELLSIQTLDSEGNFIPELTTYVDNKVFMVEDKLPSFDVNFSIYTDGLKGEYQSIIILEDMIKQTTDMNMVTYTIK